MLNRKISKEIGKQNINNLDFKKYQYKRFKFPFWAKVIYDKPRPTLVIDEDLAFDKNKKKDVPGCLCIVKLRIQIKKDLKKYIQILTQEILNPCI